MKQYDTMALRVLLERLRQMPKGGDKRKMDKGMRRFIGPSK